MKKFNRIKKNKGFTLVECIMAIALFAIMSALLFGILALTQKRAKKNLDDSDLLAEQIKDVATYGHDNNAAAYSIDSTGKLEFDLAINGGASTGALTFSYDTISKEGNTDLDSENALALKGLEANNLQSSDSLEVPGGSEDKIKISGAKGIDSIQIKNAGKTDAGVYHIELTITDNRSDNGGYTDAALSNDAIILQMPSNGDYKITDFTFSSVSGNGSNPYVQNGSQIVIVPKNTNGLKSYNVQMWFKLQKTDGTNLEPASGITLFGTSSAWITIPAGNTVTFTETEADSGLYA